MPSARKPSLILPVAGAVLPVLLLAGYVWGYYRAVIPMPDDAGLVPVYRTQTKPKGGAGAEDWTKYWGPFFAPAHWVDRRLRPSFWNRALTQEEMDVFRDPAQP